MNAQITSGQFIKTETKSSCLQRSNLLTFKRLPYLYKHRSRLRLTEPLYSRTLGIISSVCGSLKLTYRIDSTIDEEFGRFVRDAFVAACCSGTKLVFKDSPSEFQVVPPFYRHIVRVFCRCFASLD